MLLVPKQPNCHEGPGSSPSLSARDLLSSHSDGEVKVNQERRQRVGVAGILIDHEIVDRDISVQDALLVQGLVSIDTSLQGGKQGRSGAGLVDGTPVITQNDPPMYSICQDIAASLG